MLTLSARQNVMKRSLIRETWGASSNHRVTFFVGNYSCSREDGFSRCLAGAAGQDDIEQRRLQEEARAFGDLVLLPLVDVYRHHVRKLKLGLAWLLQHSDACWLVKADDDVYVRLNMLAVWLEQHVHYRPRTLVGQFWVGAPVPMHHSKIKSVHKNIELNAELLNGLRELPPFPCGATGYALTRDVAEFCVSHDGPELQGEDVSLGLWISQWDARGVRLLSAPNQFIKGNGKACLMQPTALVMGHGAMGPGNMRRCATQPLVPPWWHASAEESQVWGWCPAGQTPSRSCRLHRNEVGPKASASRSPHRHTRSRALQDPSGSDAGYYQIVDGCSADSISVKPKCVHRGWSAAVRCCSPAEAKQKCTSVCFNSQRVAGKGMADNSAPLTPLNGRSATLSEAISECTARGRRLCSPDELHSNVCCRTGCMMDRLLVWTASPCTPTATERREADLLATSEALTTPLHIFGRQADVLSKGCQHVYLDFGTNLGRQIQKLFLPEKFRGSKALPVYEQFFGSDRQRTVCAIGFEPNPLYVGRLRRLASHHMQQGWRTTIFLAAVGKANATMTLRTDSQSQLCGVGAKNDCAATIEHSLTGYGKHDGHQRVPVLDLVDFLSRHVLAALPAGSVLAKLDIEGTEWQVFPRLMTSKAACAVSRWMVEFHGIALERKDTLLKMVPNCTEVVQLDDEAYAGVAFDDV